MDARETTGGMTMKRVMVIVIAALLANGCTSDLAKNAAPVALIVTNTQQISRVDLLPGAANCDKDFGTVEVQAIEKNSNSGSINTAFNQVRITSYQVSYVRTDGGKAVPAPFVRSMDSLVTVGSAPAALGTKFVVLRTEDLSQAPFVSLLPSNGGRDPETGRATISMDVVLQLFGETLAGEKVSGSTHMPLSFCYNCGGCA